MDALIDRAEDLAFSLWASSHSSLSCTVAFLLSGAYYDVSGKLI